MTELQLAERAQFLDREDGGDEDVRREVEKLLRADDAAAGFIEASVWNDSSVLNTSARGAIESSLGDPSGETPSDDHIGRQIGAFRMVKEIGRGGMGSVYLAEGSDGEFHQKAAGGIELVLPPFTRIFQRFSCSRLMLYSK
ncbi:MAG: hypothetical protein H0V76_11505 [Blastocatellia bacterium]|nr:hypothetical protein [Blastocatellia bacterium]